MSKMTKRFLYNATPALLFIVVLYGGSYALNLLGWGHWAHFPTFVIFAASIVGCIAYAILAWVKNEYPN